MIGSGTLSIDGSAATGSNALTVDASSAAFTSTPHLSIIGGAGNDTFKFHSTDFSSNDTITDSSGSNTIQITDAATVSDAAFANVTGVQTVKLGNFTNSVTVGANASTNVGGAGNTFTIDDSAATNTALTINGSAVTADLVVIYGATSSTTDSLTGGTGSDTFEIHNAAFTSSMTINGTSGADTIQLLDTATIADTAFTHVSNVQTLMLGNFANSVTLASNANTMIGSGTLTVDASAATTTGNKLTIDATLLGTTAHLALTGGTGGTATSNNLFKLTNAQFTSTHDTINVGGVDTVQITDAASITDAAFATAGVATNALTGGMLLLGDFANSVTLGSNVFNAVGKNNPLTIDDSAASSGHSLTVNASGFQNGGTKFANLTVLPGAGADTFTCDSSGGNYTFTYKSAADSTQTAADRINSFSVANDKIDTSAVTGATTYQGQLANTSTNINAHSAAWLQSGGNTLVYVNNTGGAVAQSSAAMKIVLSGTLTLTASDFSLSLTPAGDAGNPINLALADPTLDPSDSVAVSVAGMGADWSLSGGTHVGNGTWIVQTTDPQLLTITTPSSYVGARVLHVTESWTNPDGSAGNATIADNVEDYAPGSPIFALSGDDHLTGAGANELFVFAQPIGNDTIYNFSPASDKIDLIGFDNVSSFGGIQATLSEDANGNAVIAIGTGETISLHGIDMRSLTAKDFVFDQTPVTHNSGIMTIGDGALLPLGGTIDNTGAIAMSSTGHETEIQLIRHGMTLEGGARCSCRIAAKTSSPAPIRASR